MPLFIPVAIAAAKVAAYFGIGASIAALLEGCDTEPEEPEYLHKCKSVSDLPPPLPTADEYKLSDGGFSVIADKAVSPKVAQFYLKQLPIVEKEILNLFDISSPFQNSATIYFIQQSSQKNFCEAHKACAARGIAAFPFTTTSHMDATVQFGRGMIPLAHEMSHLLREGTAMPPAGLEEGLAVYTEVMLTRNGSPTMQALPAKQIYNGPFKSGAFISTPSALFSTQVRLTDNTSSGKFSITFKDQDGVESYPPEKLMIGIPYQTIPGLLLLVSGSLASGLTLAMYQRPAYIKGNWVINLDFSSDYVCAEKGFTVIPSALTDHGSIMLPKIDRAYTISNPVSKFNDDDYITQLCFWDTIRAKYGYSAVQQIVQKMSNHSKAHQALPTPFPFFETVKAVTGMSDAEAHALFAMVGAPENVNPKLGGVCWK